MLPDRVSNPGPLTYESGALSIALRGPATFMLKKSEKIPVMPPDLALCLTLVTHESKGVRAIEDLL